MKMYWKWTGEYVHSKIQQKYRYYIWCHWSFHVQCQAMSVIAFYYSAQFTSSSENEHGSGERAHTDFCYPWPVTVVFVHVLMLLLVLHNQSVLGRSTKTFCCLMFSFIMSLLIEVLSLIPACNVHFLEWRTVTVSYMFALFLDYCWICFEFTNLEKMP